MTKNEERIIDIEEFEIPDETTVQRKTITNPKWYDVPIDFWKKNLVYQIDDTLYFDMGKYLTPKKIFTKQILTEHKFEKCKDFQKGNLWFLIKFFFMGSRFHLINPSKYIISVIGGVPQALKIKCKCGNVLNDRLWLKGYFNYSTFLTQISYLGSRFSEHEFYFRISEECPKCKRNICIYRPKRGAIFPLMLYVDSSVPDYYKLKINYDFSNMNIVSGWCHIIEKIFTSNSEKKLKFYYVDIKNFINIIRRNKSLHATFRREIETKFKFFNLGGGLE